MQVNLLLAQVEQLHIRKRDNAKGLVDLESVHSALLDASMLEGLGDSEGRCGSELGGVLSGVAPAKNLGDGLQVVLLEGGFGDEDEGGAAVGEGRGVGGGDGAVFGLEGGAKGAGFGLVELR